MFDILVGAWQRSPASRTGSHRWCVTAMNWLRAHEDGAAAFVVLASTHERALDLACSVALAGRTPLASRNPN